LAIPNADNPSVTEGSVADAGRHFSGITTRMVVEHVQAQFGAETLMTILDRAGETRREAELCDDAVWSSYAQVRSLFEATSAVLGGPNRLIAVAAEAPLDAASGAEMAQTLQDLGSPGALLRIVVDADAAFGVSTIRVSEGEEIGPDEWVIRQRFKDGFEPFREFCSFTAGMLALLPRLFGLPAGVVTEERCCCEGANLCTFRLRWQAEGDLLQQKNYFETRSRLLETRLETLQRTVSDLVSAPNPVAGLTRILSAAARAMHAPSYVLVIDSAIPISKRIHYVGLDDAEAEVIANELPTQAGQDIPGRIVVEVASTRSRYGWLAAIEPGSRRFLPQELELVISYAGLVAAALDSATALEEARRQATSSETLLKLSSSLSELLSTEEMASNLARAVPSVIDCDRSMVLLADPALNEARVVASYGFSDKVAEQFRSASLPPSVVSNLISDIAFYDFTEIAAFQDSHAFEFGQDSVAAASVPMIANGEPIGGLVVLVTDHPERLKANPNLGDALRGLSGHAAIAIRNARLVDQIRHQALHDGLTGLPNRTLILDRVEQALARTRREGHPVAALFIDLDGFKDINDSLGHAVGDKLLSALAARFAITLRETDTIGRLGGDEFVVVLEGASLDAGPEVVAERLLDVVRRPFDLDGVDDKKLAITTSIGIAVGDRSSAGELLRDADLALYQAKGMGKNRYVVYHPDLTQAAHQRIALESDLREACERGQFFLLYQPIFDLSEVKVTGVEALLRWQHPTKGVMMPDEFLSLLEESGAIIEVGAWVLEEACRQAAVWHHQGYCLDVSVNVSARQLERDQFVDEVQRALAGSDLDPSSLIIEITESTIMRNADATVGRLKVIKALGVRVAIDDFGTGYSSLAYLSQFPVDALKIDQSFLAAISDSREAGALVHTLVQLGKTLGLTTYAEGIEDKEQFWKLQDEHCDNGQGFLLAKPLEPRAFGELLARQALKARSLVSEGAHFAASGIPETETGACA
jgi:diguanylate cyclase (GGDEF)-like protein